VAIQVKGELLRRAYTRLQAHAVAIFLVGLLVGGRRLPAHARESSVVAPKTPSTWKVGPTLFYSVNYDRRFDNLAARIAWVPWLSSKTPGRALLQVRRVHVARRSAHAQLPRNAARCAVRGSAKLRRRLVDGRRSRFRSSSSMNLRARERGDRHEETDRDASRRRRS